MIMAALFSEMIGAGCITKMNRGAIILFPYDCGALVRPTELPSEGIEGAGSDYRP
jgi:hypothetical protein